MTSAMFKFCDLASDQQVVGVKCKLSNSLVGHHESLPFPTTFEVFPSDYFLAVPFWQWEDFYDPDMTEDINQALTNRLAILSRK